MVTSPSFAVAAAACGLLHQAAASVRMSVVSSLEGILVLARWYPRLCLCCPVFSGCLLVCCRGSSCNDGVPRSSIIALVGDFPFSECVCELILSSLILRCMWFLSLAGQPQKAKDNDYYGYPRSSSLQAFGSVTADIDDSLVKGSGKHGIVSSLPEGLEQASGRVDVPDDAKFAAATAIEGTLRSGPGRAKFSFF